MKRSLPFSLLLTASGLAAIAQPTAPHADDIPRLRALSERSPKIQADGEPWSVDISTREQARQFYRALYGISAGVPTDWNGNTATGVAGTTSATNKEAVRNRVNFFRAYAGVPAAVTMNATFSAKAQQAALMMSANRALEHEPPSEWMHYTADGAEAAGESNLAYGSNAAAAIDGYMADPGAGNAAVGHRRWVLYPQTLEMGTGDVDAQGEFRETNVLWVQDAQAHATRPPTRDDFVAWPPRGHVPHTLVWPRWSLSYPNADFSAATVTMTRDGAPIATSIESRGNRTDIPEPSLVWLYDGNSGDSAAAHARPAADVSYAVTVANISVGGQMRSFSYTVTVFDPESAGNDFVATTINGTSAPTTGNANRYTIAMPAFADSFQWRELQTNPNGTLVWNAEETNLRGEIDGTSASYPLRVTSPTASGTGAYHLAHPETTPQSFTLPDTFLIPPTGEGTLSFDSKLGHASTTQVARAEISANDGGHWTTVYEQRGTGSNSSPADASFQNRSVSLSAFAGQAIRVRFSYTHESGNFFPQTDPNVGGWLIDNIRLAAGPMSVIAASTSAPITSGSFTFMPASAGIKMLQARSLFFGHYGMDWGPVKTVVAQTGSSGGSGNSRIINLSVLATSGTGDNALNVGMVVAGNGPKTLLVRVVGPTLGAAPFNLDGVIPDPELLFHRQTQGAPVRLTENDDWNNDATLSAQFSTLGAFALTSPLDAALLTTQQPGVYPVVVGSKGTTGRIIVEAYDADELGGGNARLSNVSARNVVTPASPLVAGFVIDGSGSKTVLIRAVGPTLETFGLTGVLANPSLLLQRVEAGAVVREESNDDWNDDPAIASVADTLGAFALTSPADAALLITLDPGIYTATVRGAANTTGIAIVEVYEVP